MCIIHHMKVVILAMAFVAVIYLAGMVSTGNAAVQLATVILCGLVLLWYALRTICCACSQTDKLSRCNLHSDNKNDGLL